MKMIQFFSKTRTLIGLVLLLCPLLSILSAGFPLSFWPPFFLSLLFSLIPLRSTMKYLSFRLWITLCCLLSWAGIFFSAPQNPDSQLLTAAIFLGAGSSGLLLLLPPWLAVGRYVSAAPFLGLAWSCSLLSAVPLKHLACYTPGTILPLTAVCFTAGLFLSSRKPPQSQLLRNPPHDFFSPSMVKTVLFFLGLMTSMGICAGMLVTKAALTPDMLLLLSICLACGPLVSSIFIEKKGIYSSCILSIFLCESALLLICTLEGALAAAAGGIMLCLASGGVTVTLPVISRYLCGRAGYIRGLTPLLLCVPASLLFSWPFWHMAMQQQLDLEETAFFLIFLLIMSFLCIFFAWKRRFIILKNKRI